MNALYRNLFGAVARLAIFAALVAVLFAGVLAPNTAEAIDLDLTPVATHIDNADGFDGCTDGHPDQVWQFNITGLFDAPAHAPASVEVEWVGGEKTVVPLSKTAGKTAHYIHDGHLDGTVLDVIAMVPTYWSANFVISHAPCDEPPVVPQPKFIELVATKVMCEAEEYLPNWGEGNNSDNDTLPKPSQIIETTATDYIAAVNAAQEDDVCWLEDGWDFEWRLPDGASNPEGSAGDTIIGALGGDWTLFGSTNSGVVSTLIEGVVDLSHIWVREVLKEGNIPFTYHTDNSDESAEMYCHKDILNYDNYDRVDAPLVEDGTYYCVAFNAAEYVEPENEIPVAVAGDPQTVTLGDPVNLDGSGSYDNDGEVVSHAWDLGDTNSASGTTTSHTFSAVGVYTVTLVVTDNDGATSAPDTVEITVEEGDIPFGPYCGNGVVDAELAWEECDGDDTPDGFQCTAQCQLATNQCTEDVFARVMMTDVQNENDGADMTNNIYLGQGITPIPNGVWFPVYYDGSYVNDANPISSFEEVPGLAVHREDGTLTTRIHGDHHANPQPEEHVSGYIEFYNSSAATVADDNDPSQNKLEPSGGAWNVPHPEGDTATIAGKDYVWIEDDKANFWLTVTTADDSFFTTFALPPECPNELPCEEIEGDGWYGQYFNYSVEHQDMEYGNDVYEGEHPFGTWSADWYDAEYYRFDQIDADLLFGEDFFPLDVMVEELHSGSGGEHEFHFGAHWSAKATVPAAGDYAYTLTSDDDAWVYVDGVLAIDNGGLHSPVTKTGALSLTGEHVIDVFFAERHTVRSHMYLELAPEVELTPYREDCPEENQCTIEGYKYDEQENPLPNWTIGLGEIGQCTEGDEWADFVVSYLPGAGIADEADAPAGQFRGDPLKALGPAENDDTYNFVSLGKDGGELVLGFDNLIYNGAGDDLHVTETSFGINDYEAYKEKARVYASQDGSVWSYLGIAYLDQSFDLDSGVVSETDSTPFVLGWARYVKLVDESIGGSDGYDVDGIEVLNCAVYETVAETTTDVNGHYCFSFEDLELETGEYAVYEVMQSDWEVLDVLVDLAGAVFHVDSFFDVFVEITVDDTEETVLVDFWNKLKELPPVNQIPVADAGSDKGATLGNPVELDGSGSYDPDGTIVSYLWDLGDGSTSSDAIVSHTYGSTGTFTATLVVTDDEGATSSPDTAEVTITSGGGGGNLPPVANAGEDETVYVGEGFLLDGTNSYDTDGSIVSYVWDLTGGASTTGATSTHAYSATGTYVIVLTVEDNEGAVDTDEVEITVIEGENGENEPPVADAGPDQSAERYANVSFDGSGSYDLDGTIVSYEWDLKDGSTETGETFTHTFIYPGQYDVELMVTDDDGATDSDIVVITVGNVTPVCTGNCGGGGGGGGGGPVSSPIVIYNEAVEYIGNGIAVVTWNTNVPATSQVVYGDESIGTPGAPTLYGYDRETPEYLNLKTDHSVAIAGLTEGVKYWFRPVSDNSNEDEVYGIEVTYTYLGEPTACNYLLEYIQLGANNNPVEVEKLERFLNEFEGEDLAVNGIYEAVDFEAVERFQDKYFGDILGPWTHNAPTGYVYITTKKKINEIYCQREFPLTLGQQAEIAAFAGLLQGLPGGGVGGTLEDLEFNGQPVSNIVGQGEVDESNLLADLTGYEGVVGGVDAEGDEASTLATADGDEATDEAEAGDILAEADETDEEGTGQGNLAAAAGGVLDFTTSYWFILLLIIFAIALFLQIRKGAK